jgi:hypothetical protein
MDGRADFFDCIFLFLFVITSDCLCRLLHFIISFSQMVVFLLWYYLSITLTPKSLAGFVLYYVYQ